MSQSSAIYKQKTNKIQNLQETIVDNTTDKTKLLKIIADYKIITIQLTQKCKESDELYMRTILEFQNWQKVEKTEVDKLHQLLDKSKRRQFKEWKDKECSKILTAKFNNQNNNLNTRYNTLPNNHNNQSNSKIQLSNNQTTTASKDALLSNDHKIFINSNKSQTFTNFETIDNNFIERYTNIQNDNVNLQTENALMKKEIDILNKQVDSKYSHKEHEEITTLQHQVKELLEAYKVLAEKQAETVKRRTGLQKSKSTNQISELGVLDD